MMGIDSKILEKKFVALDQNGESLKEYLTLVTSLDNASTRSIIEPSRFNVCLDGATNGVLANFDSFTLRNLILSDKKPQEIWNGQNIKREILHKNLYKMVSEKGGCGVTNFGISTPFVGIFGASVLIAELIKEYN